MNNKETSESRELLKNKIRTKENGKQTRSLAEREIQRIASNLDLSDAILQVAKAIYQRSLSCKFVENRSIGVVASASVYAACKVEKKSITMEKITELTVDVDPPRAKKKTIINRTYSEMSSQLELRTGPIEPEKHIPNLIDKLDLSDEVKHKSLVICDKIEPEIKSGRSPIAIAAATVYISSLLCNEKRNQKQVSDAAKVSKKTIRVRYQELYHKTLELDL
jgi:transcription initiation factor TFIIB